MKKFDRLSNALDYHFKQPSLLEQALTHRSFATPNNERLEFLGDSILNCVIAYRMYEKYARLPEGELSRLRASLVNQQTLFNIAQSLNLGEYLLLGEGELKSGGFRRPSILADTLEAIFGAIFLDAGFNEVEKIVSRIYAPLFEQLNPKTLNKDPKTLLQEHLQGKRLTLPQYVLLGTEGEAHEQLFKVACYIAELNIRTQGAGPSRRTAEQEAAKHAYQLAIGKG